MAQGDRRDIRKSLKQKGFLESHESGHDTYVLIVDGLKTHVSTFMSRGSGYKTYGSSLLSKMARQMHLTNRELLGLIDCPIGHMDLLAVLGKRNVL